MLGLPCLAIICFSFLAIIVYVFLRHRKPEPRIHLKRHRYRDSDEHSSAISCVKVPGSSTAYYIGDHKDDLLKITAFDAIKDVSNGDIQGFFFLKGRIIGSIGLFPTVTLVIHINGEFAKSIVFAFRQAGKYHRDQLKIIQNGKELKAGAIPTEGDVDIRMYLAIPKWLCQRGCWSCRVEVYTGEDAGRKCLTDFEGETWLEGDLE